MPLSPLTDADVDAEMLSSEEAEKNKIVSITSDDGEFERKKSFNQNAPTSTIIDQQSHQMPEEQDESVMTQEQNAMHDNRENELMNMLNNESGGETVHNYGNNDSQQATLFEIKVDCFSDEIALKQWGEEEGCEYEASILAEDSAQQSEIQKMNEFQSRIAASIPTQLIYVRSLVLRTYYIWKFIRGLVFTTKSRVNWKEIDINIE